MRKPKIYCSCCGELIKQGNPYYWHDDPPESIYCGKCKKKYPEKVPKDVLKIPGTRYSKNLEGKKLLNALLLEKKTEFKLEGPIVIETIVTIPNISTVRKIRQIKSQETIFFKHIISKEGNNIFFTQEIYISEKKRIYKNKRKFNRIIPTLEYKKRLLEDGFCDLLEQK